MRQALVQMLRARGVDVVTALEAGMTQRSDTDHLDLASAQGRVLVTFNVSDFWRLHTDYLTRSVGHAGIVLVQQQRSSVGAQMTALLRLLAAKSAEEMVDNVEFLSAWV